MAKKQEVEIESEVTTEAASEGAPVTEAPKVPAPVVAKETKQSNLERWISTAFRNHSVIINVKRPAGMDKMRVMFSDYAMTLNLDNPEDQLISLGLKECSRYGKDMFIVGKNTGTSEIGDDAEFMAKMRLMLKEEGLRGIYKIRAMFSPAELEKAGLHPTTIDENALLMLALRSKKLLAN